MAWYGMVKRSELLAAQLSCTHTYACVTGMVWHGMAWYGMAWYGMVRRLELLLLVQFCLMFGDVVKYSEKVPALSLSECLKWLYSAEIGIFTKCLIR